MGDAVEDLAAVLCHQDQVLDAHAVFTGEVDARLDRKRHTGLHNVLVDKGHVAGLVVLHADGMAESVGEVSAVSGGLDHVSRGAVDVAEARAGAHDALGCLVGGADDLMDSLGFGRRLAQKYVRVISEQ